MSGLANSDYGAPGMVGNPEIMAKVLVNALTGAGSNRFQETPG